MDRGLFLKNLSRYWNFLSLIDREMITGICGGLCDYANDKIPKSANAVFIARCVTMMSDDKFKNLKVITTPLLLVEELYLEQEQKQNKNLVIAVEDKKEDEEVRNNDDHDEDLFVSKDSKKRNRTLDDSNTKLVQNELDDKSEKKQRPSSQNIMSGSKRKNRDNDNNTGSNGNRYIEEIDTDVYQDADNNNNNNNNNLKSPDRSKSFRKSYFPDKSNRSNTSTSTCSSITSCHLEAITVS